VKTKLYEHVGVVGAGAWGTALAMAASEAGRRVTLWALESEVVDAINQDHENVRFLAGVPLPKALSATGDLASLQDANAVLVVVPAQYLRATLAALASHVRPKLPLVLCAKGIERGSGKLLTEVLAECAPEATPAILSGPSFARDVARRLPTAVTIAARRHIALRLQASLGHPTFRPYASTDLTGVALGGACIGAECRMTQRRLESQRDMAAPQKMFTRSVAESFQDWGSAKVRARRCSRAVSRNCAGWVRRLARNRKPSWVCPVWAISC
jgi:glycerol-3-phosphate dehydrogenase (NAD(P)+)